MATDLTELERLHRWVGEQLENGGREMCLDESLAGFRAYQDEAERFNKMLQQSIEEAKRGEAKPLDVGALKARVRERLAESF